MSVAAEVASVTKDNVDFGDVRWCTKSKKMRCTNKPSLEIPWHRHIYRSLSFDDPSPIALLSVKNSLTPNRVVAQNSFVAMQVGLPAIQKNEQNRALFSTRSVLVSLRQWSGCYNMAYFWRQYACIFSARSTAIISGLHVAAFTSAWTSQFIRHRRRFVASCSSSTLNISLYQAASSLLRSAPTLLINSLSMALFNPLNSFRLVYLISGCSS